MHFDSSNKVVALCAEGMEAEGQGDKAQASVLFNKAWKRSETDFEKFTSAHYVARHQESITDKLFWDQTALKHALLIEDSAIKSILPSLYLNIGKCYEDLGDRTNAISHYEQAQDYVMHLPDDGYGQMIRNGVDQGIKRVSSTSFDLNSIEEA